MPWKIRLVIAGRRWVLTCLCVVSGLVELTRLIIMRFVRCRPRSGEEWALLLLDGGSFMFGILVKISWSWSLSLNPKGASGFATKFCGFWKD